MAKDDYNQTMTVNQVRQLETTSRRIGVHLARGNREAAITIIDDFFANPEAFTKITHTTEMGLKPQTLEALDAFSVFTILDLRNINWRKFLAGVHLKYLVVADLVAASERLGLNLDFSGIPKNILKRQ